MSESRRPFSLVVRNAFDRIAKGSSALAFSVFLAQVTLVYVVVITCLYNLTVYPDSSNSKLWTVLLSSSFGLLLPNPTLKSPQQQNVSHPPQQ